MHPVNFKKNAKFQNVFKKENNAKKDLKEIKESNQKSYVSALQKLNQLKKSHKNMLKLGVRNQVTIKERFVQ